VCLRWQLPKDVHAYVDAEWIPGSGADDVPAVVVSPTGEVGRSGAGPAWQSDGIDADTAAALWLFTLAEESVGAARTHTRVEVSGRGAVAALIAHGAGGTRLGLERLADRPTAVIETTGEPSTVGAACRRVADLGVVILAGEAAGRTVRIDLYPDVHLRGLELVGVGETPPAPAGDAQSRLPPWLIDGLVGARPGEPLPDATWYRLG
jgi:hypothetical protein